MQLFVHYDFVFPLTSVTFWIIIQIKGKEYTKTYHVKVIIF